MEDSAAVPSLGAARNASMLIPHTSGMGIAHCESLSVTYMLASQIGNSRRGSMPSAGYL
jgi:hypothetical protein